LLYENRQIKLSLEFYRTLLDNTVLKDPEEVQTLVLRSAARVERGKDP
jgi:hypothetical protein